MLLTSLATQPLPISPTWKMLAPMCWSSGLQVSNACVSPPTMTASVPRSAPATPPLTGASSMVTPCAAKAAQTCLAMLGESVLRSTKINPGRAAAMMPLVPSATCSISRGPGSEAKTILHAWATALGLSAGWAPRLTMRARFEGLTSYASTVCPASMRWRHMGVPILPTPMNPSCILRLLVQCMSSAATRASVVAPLGRASASRLKLGKFAAEYRHGAEVSSRTRILGCFFIGRMDVTQGQNLSDLFFPGLLVVDFGRLVGDDDVSHRERLRPPQVGDQAVEAAFA